MIREFGLSIKFRRSGGGEKMEKRFVRGLGRARNKKKIAFRGLGRARNKKKWLSEASDEQKTGKNGFSRPRMSKKQEKIAFRGLG